MNNRKTLFLILVLVSFYITKTNAQSIPLPVYYHYHFTTIAPSGQTLYCYLYLPDINNTFNPTDTTLNPQLWKVAILPPTLVYDDQDTGPSGFSWDGYQKPSGNLIVPDSVVFRGIKYGVTQVFLGSCDNLTSVTMPPAESNTKAYLNAFGGCNLNTFRPGLWGTTSYEECLPYDIWSLWIHDSLFYEDTVYGGYYYSDPSYYHNLIMFRYWTPFYNTVGHADTIICSPIPYYYGSYNTASGTGNMTCTNLILDIANLKDSVYETSGSPFIYAAPQHLVIGENTNKIPRNMFGGVTSLTNIDVQRSNPPIIHSSTFAEIPTNIPIHVPCGSIDAYHNAPYWNVFTNIQEDGTCANTITTTTNNSNFGLVVGGGNYYDGETATLYAAPKAYHYFVHWQDGNGDNPRTVTVSGDSSFMATFAVVDTLGTIHDTIYIHDTVYVGIVGVDALNVKVYSNGGQIVVEGAEQNAVTLFDISGRIIATRQEQGEPLRFEVPATGTYLVKIGRHAARKIVVVR